MALAVLAILDWLALLPMVHRWDESVTIWLQRAAPAFDWPGAIVVFLGNAEVLIPAVVAGGLLLLWVMMAVLGPVYDSFTKMKF